MNYPKGNLVVIFLELFQRGHKCIRRKQIFEGKKIAHYFKINF